MCNVDDSIKAMRVVVLSFIFLETCIYLQEMKLLPKVIHGWMYKHTYFK